MPEPRHRGQELQPWGQHFCLPLEIELLVRRAFVGDGAFLVVIGAVLIGNSGVGCVIETFFLVVLSIVRRGRRVEFQGRHLPVCLRVGLQVVEKLLDQRPGPAVTIAGLQCPEAAEHPAQCQRVE